MLGFEGFSDGLPDGLDRRLRLPFALVLLAVLMVLDWFVPPYWPFPTVYVIFAGVAAWLGGLRLGVLVSATIIVDLAFHERLHDGASPWAVGWGLTARLVLYAVVLGTAYQGRRSIDRLHRRATTDPLTGLANRRHFDGVVNAELRRAWRYHRPVCVAVLDVNKFKVYNDTHGHIAGDRMLVDIATALLAGVRDTDVVARIGGDEFAILFPETALADARVALDHVAQVVAEHYPAGVAAGVNFLDPTLDAVLEVGDRAMYLGKRGQDAAGV